MSRVSWLSRYLDVHRALLVDVALAAGVFVVVAGAMAANLGAGRRPDALAYLIALCLGALMLVRRRYPALVVLATAVGLLGYYVAGYSPVGLPVPMAAALFSAAEQRRLRTAIGIAAGLTVIAYGYRLLVARQDVGYLFGYDLPVTMTLMAAALALGDAVRARSQLRAEARRREEMALAERHRAVTERLEAERLRIARDVHDVLAHTVAVVTLQADVASEALPDDPAAARRALGLIRTLGSEANRQLRSTLGLLRRPGDDIPRTPTPGLDYLDQLVRATSQSGLEVDLEVVGDREPLPAEVDTTAYRIVQESLTNCLRHARARRVQVLLRWTAKRLEVEVTDDGVGGPLNREGGGLMGMRERATLIGGTVEAGSLAEGGFRVAASLPKAGVA